MMEQSLQFRFAFIDVLQIAQTLRLIILNFYIKCLVGRSGLVSSHKTLHRCGSQLYLCMSLS